jgi:hypothetical protein
MSYSFLLLAASFVAGQSAPAPIAPAPATEPTASAPASTIRLPASQEPVYEVPVSEKPKGFLGRMRGLLPWNWGKSTTTPSTAQPTSQPGIKVVPGPDSKSIVVQPGATTAEPPLATGPVQQTSFNAKPTLLLPKYRDHVGNAEDYKWITGQLSYTHSHGGMWVLYYTVPDQVDRFGGSLVLMPTPELKKYHDGELVTVEGEVVNGKTPPKGVAGAYYRAKSIAHVSLEDLKTK